MIIANARMWQYIPGPDENQLLAALWSTNVFPNNAGIQADAGQGTSGDDRWSQRHIGVVLVAYCASLTSAEGCKVAYRLLWG